MWYLYTACQHYLKGLYKLNHSTWDNNFSYLILISTKFRRLCTGTAYAGYPCIVYLLFFFSMAAERYLGKEFSFISVKCKALGKKEMKKKTSPVIFKIIFLLITCCIYLSCSCYKEILVKTIYNGNFFVCTKIFNETVNKCWSR